MIVHGDRDPAVPVTLARRRTDVIGSLKMQFQYIEVPGGDHGSVITSHQAEIVAVFARHFR